MDTKRITLSLDKDWRFHLGEIPIKSELSHGYIYGTAKSGSCKGPMQSDYNTKAWEKINLPHDFSVMQNFDKNGAASWGYKPKGRAWYRKDFILSSEYEGKQITLEFNGIAKDSVIYFNGSILKRNYSSYNSFSVDITDRAYLNGVPNVLAVFVDATGWEGWWYEGAGIYRHANLVIKNKVNIDRNGVFVKPRKLSETDWNVEISTTINNTNYENAVVELKSFIVKSDTLEQIAEASMDMSVYAMENRVFVQNLRVNSPALWDVENPELYKVISILLLNGEYIDEEETTFGFRTIKFDAKRGFFLNEKPLKIFGTCNHEDYAGVGVAVPDEIFKYKIKRLKEMGSNAYRCSHGMPSKELLDECDKQGMLVMDENRSFETSDQVLSELREMVKRDRNHPSVIMYSIFNEEPLQSTLEGKKMALHMKEEIKKLDNTRYVTGASNGSVRDENGSANVLDVCGINYQPAEYEKFHEMYPDIPIVGSETTSSFSVRGCYENNDEKHEIMGYDECKSDWGNTVRETWQSIMDKDYVAGGFMWTGFDYLGEPTPYTWGSVSSFFGMMDTCGFPKDGYFLSSAIFKSEPVCYVVPHWSYPGKEGKVIKVMSMTNCEEAELFINNISKGKKKVDKLTQVIWNVPFKEGELKLVGYNGGKAVAADIKYTANEVSDLLIKPVSKTVYNDGEYTTLINIFGVDKNGNVVPFADDKFTLEVSGGTLVAMANGNPNCHEEFTSNERSLFNGCAQAIVRVNEGVKALTITAKTDRIAFDYTDFEIKSRDKKRYVESVEELYLLDWKMSSVLQTEKPNPNQVFSDSDNNSLEPVRVINGRPEKFVVNVNKYALYRTKVSIPEKINDKTPVLHFHGLWGEAEVYIDGICLNKCSNEWQSSLDVELTNISGEKEITVIIKSLSVYGAGICSSVVIR